jgi:transcriptional regulator with XRE-family HTH domain
MNTSCLNSTTAPLPQTPVWTSAAPNGNVAAGAVAAIAPSNQSLPPNQRLHRLSEVRRQEGMTRERIARFLKVSVDDVRKQELPCSDMMLSDLLRWQQALEVPLTELLQEPDTPLSPPVKLRAQLLRVMKTIRLLQERTRQASVRRLADMLAGQLVEIMPELEGTSGWPAVGHRRKLHELGQAFARGMVLRGIVEDER